MTRANKVWALVLSCGIFVVLGISSSTLGAVLPYLAKNAGIELGTAGAIITTVFLGALLAQLAIGPINDRVGPARVLAVAMLVAGTSLVAASLSHYLVLTLLFIFISGTGTGAIIVSTNVMLAMSFESRSVFALNFSNVFYGIGAICGPAICALMAQQWDTTLPIMWVTAGLLALLLPGALLLRVPRHFTSTVQDSMSGTSIYRSPLLWAMAGMLLIYVGTEAGTSGWSITYLNRATGMELDGAALAISGFYIALTAGRLAGSIAGVWIGARSLLTVSYLGASVGAIMYMLSGGNATTMVSALVLFGFFLGPVYPTVVSLVTTTFVEAPGRAASFVMAMGSIGGMTIPWLLGALLDLSGTYASITLLAGCALGMLALHIASALAPGRRASGVVIRGQGSGVGGR